MEIVLIAAVDINLAIGKDGTIPWDIKEDLKFFKEKTENTAIIMGRATYDSIGRPLPNRKNIVMTKSIQGREGVTEVSSIEKALEEAIEYSKTVSVIGGEYIYKEFLEMASEMLLTEIDLDTDGDTYFPRWEESEWLEVSRESKIDDSQKINYEFVKYKRRN